MADSQFARPELPQLIATIRSDLLTRFQQDVVLRRMDAEVYSRVQAAAVHTLYGYIDYLARNMLPDMCDDDWLYRHARIKRCLRKNAVSAKGFARWDGIAGTPEIPAGTQIQRDDQVTFTTLQTVKASGGLLRVPVIADVAGSAGNGSPVGITATLWRRSPAAANEVAWVNTSGDTYDIYINIGQYAYWLIAQYDYTGNANVTLHSTPEYSSVQPGNSTSGQTYTLFNSLMKPTAGDVEALSVNGGRLNGSLGIGTDNALGGNSIVLGDNDTGFKQDGDGVLGIYANNARVGYIDNSGLHMSVDVLTNGGIRAGDGKRLSLTSNNNSTMTATFNLWGDANRPTVIELDDDQGWHLYSQRNPDGSIVFTVNGDITANTLRAGGAIYQNNGDIFGSVWGNSWLSLWINNNFVADVQLGAGTSVTTWNNAGSWPNTPGYVVTSVWKDYQGENIDGIAYAPLQKRVGNQWYTVQGGTA